MLSLQSYYEKKQEVERAKYEAEMEKQMEEQYGENKKKGAEFIANYKKEAGVKTTASGLAYQSSRKVTVLRLRLRIWSR